jgi:hypothetical protein
MAATTALTGFAMFLAAVLVLLALIAIAATVLGSRRTNAWNRADAARMQSLSAAIAAGTLAGSACPDPLAEAHRSIATLHAWTAHRSLDVAHSWVETAWNYLPANGRCGTPPAAHVAVLADADVTTTAARLIVCLYRLRDTGSVPVGMVLSKVLPHLPEGPWLKDMFDAPGARDTYRAYTVPTAGA